MTSPAIPTVRVKFRRPHPKQQQVLDEAKRFNVLACGRRWGKTELGQELLIDPALRGYPTAYFTPTYKMLADVWRSVLRTTLPARESVNQQQHRVGLLTGGAIDMWSLDVPDVARGRKYKRVVIDEAATVKDLMRVWQEVIRPTLTDYRGDAWFLSTPKGEQNDFKELYDWGLDPLHTDWAAWRMPTSTNPFISPAELEAAKLDLHELIYAQEYEADFTADASAYIPLGLWDALYDKDLPALMPDPRGEAVVLSLDAAVTGDCFAVVAVTRHPAEGRHGDPAIRKAKRWRPEDFEGGRIDFEVVERFLRFILQGGCLAQHPPSMPAAGCELCERKEFAVPRHNVVQLTYDRHQLEDMMQGIRRDGLVWVDEFDQGAERLVGDAQMFKLAMRGKLAHNVGPVGGEANQHLREHIGNAQAKLQADEESKMRIIKRHQDRKIDLAVAAAMGVKRILDLNV